ncbi:hypothetical protein QKU48_gp1063 [Fadolivirus algeromassiliense]|uniref:Uncharacterized protein n=1 Tax=Fadolivirus FV1/VV64 TaxID=3070911 RepID=A0A7D3R1Q8_9VIRU|nr:hypothetical protein QKU48_gp1063 [Fadolivirus algeromassiliense]QKF94521.1 hypothetical protein Fadolivirus_1_1063 [Fadolivirus FV1/VV64]
MSNTESEKKQKNIIICINNNIMIYMYEYIRSLVLPLKCKIMFNNLNYQYEDNNIYIFIQSLPLNVINKLNKNMFLLNTEQLTIDMWKNRMETILKNDIQLIDYSSENISLLNNNNIIQLPYQYNEEEINHLKKLINENNKTYDVVFVGNISSRRRYVCDELLKNGIKVLILDRKYGNNRDMEISNAKILLNIHFDETYNIYEHIRCDRWIFSGMMVVSEKSINNETLDINDLVIFEKYDNLLNKVTDVVKNYDKYYSEFMEKHTNVVNKIRNDRLEYINKFKSIINN